MDSRTIIIKNPELVAKMSAVKANSGERFQDQIYDALATKFKLQKKMIKGWQDHI